MLNLAAFCSHSNICSSTPTCDILIDTCRSVGSTHLHRDRYVLFNILQQYNKYWHTVPGDIYQVIYWHLHICGNTILVVPSLFNSAMSISVRRYYSSEYIYCTASTVLNTYCTASVESTRWFLYAGGTYVLQQEYNHLRKLHLVVQAVHTHCTLHTCSTPHILPRPHTICTWLYWPQYKLVSGDTVFFFVLLNAYMLYSNFTYIYST
jgi:hypothetical protein